MFMIVSFLMHPVVFVKDMVWSYKTFDSDGNPRDGSI